MITLDLVKLLQKKVYATEFEIKALENLLDIVFWNDELQNIAYFDTFASLTVGGLAVDKNDPSGDSGIKMLVNDVLRPYLRQPVSFIDHKDKLTSILSYRNRN